jgi:hypothetical protein
VTSGDTHLLFALEPPTRLVRGTYCATVFLDDERVAKRDFEVI